MEPRTPSFESTRRDFLRAGLAGAGTVMLGGGIVACGKSGAGGGAGADVTIRARRAEVGLGSRSATTWTFDGRLPGRELRLTQGRATRIRLVNELDEPTSIHWHGIRLRNAADGVPGMTQKAVEPGGEFLYEFTPPDAGTYFFHSHVGTQLDRGLYAPLIVDARRETLTYDREAVLMFDDWLDGVSGTPDKRLKQLRASGMDMSGMNGMSGMGGMGMGSKGGANAPSPMAALGRHTNLDGRRPAPGSAAWLANALEAGRLDAGDVRDYPLYLVNGRPPEDPSTVAVRRGDRVRLRLINPSADTLFCVFVEGHELEVVAADGARVKPVRTDAVLLGMGERYDVMVDAKAGGFARIFGMPLGKRGRAMGMLRYGDATGRAPRPGDRFAFPKRIVSYGDLVPVDAEPRAKNGPRVIRLDLAQGPGPYSWTIGGQAFDGGKADPIKVERGEHVRFVMRNRSAMPHPMHLHGHSFAVGGAGGPVKDTALAMPRRELALDWVADNPGTWAYHCHNVYHQDAGMMRRVEVA